MVFLLDGVLAVEVWQQTLEPLSLPPLFWQVSLASLLCLLRVLPVLLSLSFMKIWNRTGATVNSLFGADPREDRADSWDISVCSCWMCGTKQRKLLTISRLEFAGSPSRLSLPKFALRSRILDCDMFQSCFIPWLPTGTHLVWYNKGL